MPDDNIDKVEGENDHEFHPGVFTSLDDAWEFVDLAWEDPGRKERIKLAKTALKISADCAGAHLILGHTEISSPMRIQHFTRAISAAHRVLAPTTLEQLASDTWEPPEVESAMYAYLYRALTHLAEDSKDEAIADLNQLLRLDPLDRLNAHGQKLLALIAFEEHEAALAFIRGELSTFDPDAFTWYGKALIYFRLYGDSVFARRTLSEAFIFFPQYRPGIARNPETFPVPDPNDSPPNLPDAAGLLRFDEDESKDDEPFLSIFDTPILFAILFHLQLWEGTNGSAAWASSVVAAGPQIRYDNDNLGDGPALFFSSDSSTDFRRCHLCRGKNQPHHFTLVLAMVNGETLGVELNARYCSTCDLIDLNFERLLEKLISQHPQASELDFVPLGFLTDEDIQSRARAEAIPDFNEARYRPFRSLDDGDASRTEWPTLEDRQKAIQNVIKKTEVRDLPGPVVR